MEGNSSFINRYKSTFGQSNAFILKLTNLIKSEVKGHGVWIHSGDGEKWLDFGSYGINLLGHTHPRIVEAAICQIGKMGLSSKILGSEEVLCAAEELLESTKACFDGVIFGNSGSEVVELSLRVAILMTGKPKIIAFFNSYHGKSLGALSVSDSLQKYKLLLKGYDVEFISVFDDHRLSHLLETDAIAAVIIEPVQGEGGIVSVSAEILEAVIDLCDKNGAISIFDEIQTGLGRCGIMWRHLNLSKCPDIILTGKALGGGVMPVSAMIYNRRKVKRIADDPIISTSTFSSSPLAASVVRATLDVIQKDNIICKASHLSCYTFSYLKSALLGSSIVVEIRGEGIMVGIELITSQVVANVIFEAIKHGLLITFCLLRPTVIRVYPPAIVSDEELKYGLDILIDAILAVEQKGMI